MKNSKSETSIIKDIAVFDYVAGQQSDDVRKNFENLLEQDEGLLQEVAIEEQLRSTLEQDVGVKSSEPVPMSNFDALLERIDNQSSELVDTVSTDTSSAGYSSSANSVVVGPWAWQKQFNIAASFAVLAMIGFIGFNQTTEPNFITLSNQSASAEIDFNALVDDQKLVKLELAAGLAPSDIDELLKGYQLRSIQSGTLGQVILVSASQSVDAEQIADWIADTRINNAALVSVGAK